MEAPMKVASLSYVPPGNLNAAAFVRNILYYVSTHPVIWFSEREYPGLDIIKIPDPTNLKLSRNRVSLHNRLFLHAVKIAQEQKLQRFLYLESDCRCGRDGWDEVLFNEAAPYTDMFAAGTPSLYNTTRLTKSQSVAISAARDAYTTATGFKVPVYDPPIPRPIGCWFIMGAGAVYSTAVTAEIFMGFERDAHQKAITTPAFDLFLGMRCFQLFGANAIKKLPFLPSVFSSFGDKILNEQQRVDLIKSGRVALVHQIKSDLDCL